MSSPIIDEIEKAQMKTELPVINVGDKVKVSNIIKEGKKQRTQIYEGTIIEIKHGLSRQSFTVRKIVDSIGVEKTFLLHSPLVSNIEVIKYGKVRRAKLFYLRDRVGSRATTIKTATKKTITAAKKAISEAAATKAAKAVKVVETEAVETVENA